MMSVSATLTGAWKKSEAHKKEVEKISFGLFLDLNFAASVELYRFARQCAAFVVSNGRGGIGLPY